MSTSENLDLLKSTLVPSKPGSPSSVSSTWSTPRSTSRPALSTPTRRNLSSFAPWDRDQFVGRLSTFKDVFWSQLPEELCELEWSRRGWVERKGGRKGVECGLCLSKVEVIWDWNQLRESVLKQRQLQEEANEDGEKENGAKENETEASGTLQQTISNTNEDIYSKYPSNDTESTELLLQHYKPLLSSGHTAKCPWTSRTTDITVLRLPPNLLSLPSLISRLTTLTPVLPFLPSASRISTPKPLPEDLPASLTTYDPRVLQCGITGWSGSLLGTKGILTCSTCHRRVGLWLFTQEGKLDEEKLDLLAEHKRYCPWINAGVQTGMAAWEYMVSLVEPRGSGKRTREDDGDGKESRFKKLREMLKGVRK
jgi:C3HC zinc finger-like/Rsm1-like